MNLLLHIYEDDTLTNVKRVAEADRLKIPYRVSMHLIESLENLDLDSEADLIKLVGNSAGQLDKIIKATFGLSELELDCVDAGELVGVAIELYKWAMEKIKTIKGNNLKNVVTAAQ